MKMVALSGAPPTFLLNITVLTVLFKQICTIIDCEYSCSFRVSLLLLLFPRFSINRSPLLDEQSAGAVRKVSVLERVYCSILHCSLPKREIVKLAAAQGGTWVNLSWDVPLASQSPYPIKVYSVANYRPLPKICNFRDPNLVMYLPVNPLNRSS